MPLYGPRGDVLQYAKAKPPKTGDVFGTWAGRENENRLVEMPSGSLLQIDLSRLKLSDFRQMTVHYQINSSLNLLAFMQHQAKWKINHPNKKVRDLLTENLQQIWTQLIAARTQANWCGYAPSILEWDNYSYDNTTRITKVKDLLPEESMVNWKEVPLWAPPNTIPQKEKVYDGIKKFGQSFPVPKENTFWYPLLRQNGNFYGRKLLKAVFTSYFFSMLVHMYANRYFERFGQPTPIGRAPFDDEVVVGGTTYSGSQLMEIALRNLRSGGVIMLPSDKVQDGSGQAHYEYDINYLENQMRGADFERMLVRYDQEMALGTFTPLLLQQTADVGSYNLGGLHYEMYLMTQNGMNGDFGMYVDKFILRPIQYYNFAQGLEPATIEFETQDNSKKDLVMAIIQAMLSNGTLGVDTEELGEQAGLTLHEIEAIAIPTDSAPGDPTNTGDKSNDPTGSGKPAKVPRGETGNPSRNERERIRHEVVTRIRNQVQNSMADGSFGPETQVNIPFTKQLIEQWGKHHGYYIERNLREWTDEAVTMPAWRNADHFASELEKQFDKLASV